MRIQLCAAISVMWLTMRHGYYDECVVCVYIDGSKHRDRCLVIVLYFLQYAEQASLCSVD